MSELSDRKSLLARLDLVERRCDLLEQRIGPTLAGVKGVYAEILGRLEEVRRFVKKLSDTPPPPRDDDED